MYSDGDGGRHHVGYNGFDYFWKKLKVRTHRWMQNWILWHIKKYFNVLSFFEHIWLKSLQKVLIWHQNNFPKYFQYGNKKMQNLMLISNRWKASRKFTQRKLEGWELLYTVLKDEKVHNFYTFILITFLYEFFNTFFNVFEISIKFCVFWYPYQNVLNKIFVGSY